MFIPEWIIDQRRQILQLLNVTCGREDITVSTDLTSKNEGYLLMVRCSGGIDRKWECPLWTGKSIKVEPTAETVIALSHLQVIVITFNSFNVLNAFKPGVFFVGHRQTA